MNESWYLAYVAAAMWSIETRTKLLRGSPPMKKQSAGNSWSTTLT